MDSNSLWCQRKRVALIPSTSASDLVTTTTTPNPVASGSCRSDEFECDDGSCVGRDFRCDNVPDCGDASDESNCSRFPCFSCFTVRLPYFCCLLQCLALLLLSMSAGTWGWVFAIHASFEYVRFKSVASQLRLSNWNRIQCL